MSRPPGNSTRRGGCACFTVEIIVDTRNSVLLLVTHPVHVLTHECALAAERLPVQRFASWHAGPPAIARRRVQLFRKFDFSICWARDNLALSVCCVLLNCRSCLLLCWHACNGNFLLYCRQCGHCRIQTDCVGLACLPCTPVAILNPYY